MKNIGVIGCLPELPVDFPLLMPENSGNMSPIKNVSEGSSLQR